MLLDILKLYSATVGTNLDNPDERTFVVAQANLAAKRLYESCDLAYSCVDELFNVSVSSHLITLPPRVGLIRGMRYSDGRRKVTLDAPQIRYHESGFNDTWPLCFRERKPSALATDITNATPLTFSIPLALSFDFSVYVKGSTENSDSVVETLAFTAGTTELDTTNDYLTVDAITLSQVIPYNLLVEDPDDNTLATIPNHHRTSRHRVVQVLESYSSPIATADSYAVEMYYKLALPKMEDDYDSFICGDDLYDECIYWEMLRAHYAKRENAEGAQVAGSMVISLRKTITVDIAASQRKKFDAADNKFLRLANSGLDGGRHNLPKP